MRHKHSSLKLHFLRCICLFLSINFTAQATTIYQWADDKGTEHYTDAPPANHAKKLNIAPEIITKPAIPTPSLQTNLNNQPIKTTTNYNNLNINIIQPQDEQTLQYDHGIVEVKINLNLALPVNNKIVLYVDGQKIKEVPPALTTSIIINNVERGEHHLQAQIIDQNGIVIKTSEKVVFFIHQHSINN